ncbi:uncharacterized protein SCHCODRAFT_02534462 [Schizophyllum commune H4-8]|uniref:uncharacterized protein n=1 Tax=Schizophyllum commune (strain H4-8 / FGSC 9210) TaxID=578458 RepID=UPI002160B75E|nr:uncharacterized protein SCHCODRAFT_02534462 [Schizophyllum commune H4-8]KAI5894537.1 hypothetical protein SCHCODRAFT_02534462 [Schizophyllum commune H4-8]
MQLEALLDRATSLANTDLMRGGFVPSAAEERLLLDDSGALKSGLAAVQEEIKKLTVQQERITRQLDLISSTLAPVRRVPREILSHIFVVFLELSRSDDPTRLVSRTVAGVCRLWRDVALDTPRLWTQIRVSRRKSDPTSVLDRCVEQASRAGGLPLDLSVHDSGPGSRLLEELLVRLGSRTARLQSINLSGRFPFFDEGQPELDLSGLRVLKIQTGLPSRAGSLACLQSASNLTSLIITFHTNRADDPLRMLKVLTFPKLEHLVFSTTHVSVMPLLDLLQSCSTTLESLHLGFDEFTPVEDPDFIPEMIKLRIVRLRRRTLQMLMWIDTPAVEDVYLDGAIGAVGTRSETFTTLHTFADFSKIKRLTLNEIPTYRHYETAFWACFERLHDLEVLDICYHGWLRYELYDELIPRLTLVEGRSPLLPRLTTLYFRFVLLKESVPALCTMILSRRDARLRSLLDVVPLRKVVTNKHVYTIQ